MAKPRCKTFKAFMQRHLKDEMRDIARHGADAGYAYLTYTRDTVELFDAYQTEIWDMAYEMACDMGEPVLTMIAGFNRVDMADTIDGFKNLMVWFAAETIARNFDDAREAA